MIMRGPSWSITPLERIGGQHNSKPSQQLMAQVADPEGVEGVEGISASPPSAPARGRGRGRGGGGGCTLDVVYSEPRYGMHVGVFSACAWRA